MMNKNGKEKLKRGFAMVCAALVAIALLASIILPAALAVTQQELDAAKDKTEQAKEDVESAQKQKDAAVSEYNTIDKQISETEAEIGIIESQIVQTESDIAIKEEELAAAEKEYNDYEVLFQSRARAMYENSDIQYLEILFGADSFGDFLSKLEMISQLMDYDQGILTGLEEARQEIEDAKTELEDVLARQQENAKTLANRKSNLDKVLAEKQALIDDAMADIEKYKAIYEAAEKAEKELIEQNKQALSYEANPVEYTGGQFAWPVPQSRRITSKYGYRIHPVYKTRRFHSGIDIGAGYGLNIVATADGTVTMATTNGGYGKCVIINHGSGISSLYGHCSVLNVSVGTKVTRGQVIAKVGSTGVSTGPHLHFEIRKNGATTDPLGYIQ